MAIFVANTNESRKYRQALQGGPKSSHKTCGDWSSVKIRVGLLGLKALIRNRALLSCYEQKLYFVGPGKVEIVLPPGSAELDLVMSESGHLLLPISEFARVAGRVSSNSDAPLRALAHAQWAA